MESANGVARKALLPVVLLLGLAINLVDRDVHGSLGFASLIAITLVFFVPEEQRKLQLVAYGVLAVFMLAVFAPRLFDAAERL